MKLKIDNDAMVEEFLEDTLLLGIVAPIKDYVFCWHLNQVLGFDFNTPSPLQSIERFLRLLDYDLN